MKPDYLKLKLPTPIDLGIMRGDDRSFVFDLYDDTGTAVAATGATITFTIKYAVDGSTILTKTVGSGITISTNPTNRFTVAIVPSDTSSIDPGEYKYDVAVTLSAILTTVALGSFFIVGDIA